MRLKPASCSARHWSALSSAVFFSALYPTEWAAGGLLVCVSDCSVSALPRPDSRGTPYLLVRQAAVLARRLDDRFAYRFMVPQPIGSPQEVQGRLADLDELIELSHGYGSSPSSARGSLPGLSSSFGFRLENPTGGLRSPRGAAVVIARHPKQARVVSAEFGERRRAGNGIRHVIVTAVGMRDGVPANRAGATLEPNDLALKTIIARQDDAANSGGTLRCLVMRGDKCD